MSDVVQTMFCCICRRPAAFLPFGHPPRPDARCPFCGALERHRLAGVFFRRQANLFIGSPKRMLHIAPEPCMARYLRDVPGIQYLSADVIPGRAMVTMDITRIAYPNQCFDVIYCSHVLEHVEDDQRAIAEMHRVLTGDGWAVFQVPIFPGPTYENSGIRSPKDRERVFGQWDHVRRYGTDFPERLRRGGFTVRRYRSSEIASPAEAQAMALERGADIFLCIR